MAEEEDESDNVPAIQKRFDAVGDDDFLAFDRIPKVDRRHDRPDLCGMLYLHEKLGAKRGNRGRKPDMVSGADHDVIYLDGEMPIEKLTDADVLYLKRCGVLLDDDNEHLFMFV